MFSYHVQCGGLKKIVNIAEKEEIYNEIRRLFKLSKETVVLLQIFNQDWDDYVDVESLDELPDRAKLVAITINRDAQQGPLVASIPLLDQGVQTAPTSAPGVDGGHQTTPRYDQPPQTTPQSDPGPHTISKSNQPPQITPKVEQDPLPTPVSDQTPQATPLADQIPQVTPMSYQVPVTAPLSCLGSKVIRVSQLKPQVLPVSLISLNQQEQMTSTFPKSEPEDDNSQRDDSSAELFPIPSEYEIPLNAIPPKLRGALNLRQALGQGLISSLLSVIYKDVTRRHNKFYLTTQDATTLSRAILRAFPHLMGNLSSLEAVRVWYKKVQEKFRNQRKRRDRNHPSVAGQMKSKHLVVTALKNQRKRVKRKSPDDADCSDQRPATPKKKPTPAETSEGTVLRNRLQMAHNNFRPIAMKTTYAQILPGVPLTEQYTQSEFIQGITTQQQILPDQYLRGVNPQEMTTENQLGLRKILPKILPKIEACQDNLQPSNFQEITPIGGAQSLCHDSSSGSLPIPFTYELPVSEMSLSLRDALNSKQFLSKIHTCALLSAIYEDVTFRLNKFYPTGQDAVTLAAAILRAYPHLKGKLSEDEALRFWHDKLIVKFRNTRKRTSRHHPAVAGNMKGSKVTAGTGVKDDGAQHNSEPTNYPLCGDNEDEKTTFYENHEDSAEDDLPPSDSPETKSAGAAQTRHHCSNRGSLPIPATYEIPLEGTPLSLQDALKSKKMLSHTQMRFLLSAIYEDVTLRLDKFYLSFQDVSTLSSAILRDYPHLKGSSSDSEAAKLWYKRVQYKFANQRKKISRSHPAVARRMKGKINMSDTQQMSPNSMEQTTQNPLGLTNCPPCKLGEDDGSSNEVQVNPANSKPGNKRHSLYGNSYTDSIPLTYEIPRDRMPLMLKVDLDSEEKLSQSQLSALLNTVYQDVTSRFNIYYPDNQDVATLSSAILGTYPYLKGSLSDDEAEKAWCNKVKIKFKNQRKKEREKDSHPPAVSSKTTFSKFPTGTNMNLMPSMTLSTDNDLHLLAGSIKQEIV